MLFTVKRDSITFENKVVIRENNLQDVTGIEKANSNTVVIGNWLVPGIKEKVPFNNLTK